MTDADVPAPTETAAPRGNVFTAHPRWVVFGLFVVAALLRLPLLDRPVWFDEACMSSQRIGTVPQLLATLYVDIHPPLFVTFMHVWNSWFGDGEVVMRLPALLAGLLCIPLTWWTGRRLVGDGAALFAAAMLALSPVHAWYCAEARLYTPMVMCTLLLFGTFDRLLQVDDDGAWVRRPWLYALHLLNVAVMLALHYYLAVFVAALAALAPLFARGMTRRARGILIWHGVAVMLLAGFVAAKSALGTFETSQGYLRSLDWRGLFEFTFDWAWTGNTLQTSDSPLLQGLGVGFRWLGVGLVVVGVTRTLVEVKQRPRALLALAGALLLPGFLMACVLVGYDNTYLERSIIPTLPFVLLLAGAGVTWTPRALRPAVGGLGVALGATAMVTLFASFETRWTVYKPHPDWRSAARWLGARIDAGAAGRPVFTSMPNPRSLSYYDARIQDEKNLRPPLSPDEIGEKVERRLGSWFGELAREQFTRFAAHNEALLRDAKLVVRPCAPTPAELDLPDDRPDDVCYVVRNEWHPPKSVDGSVEALLAHDGVEVLETAAFAGVTVYEVRIRR